MPCKNKLKPVDALYFFTGRYLKLELAVQIKPRVFLWISTLYIRVSNIFFSMVVLYIYNTLELCMFVLKNEKC